MGHHHTHNHHTHNINNKFIVGIALNVIFVIVELLYGWQTNSLALIADATHNATDIIGLLIAWFGFLFSHKKAPKRFTYGYKNATIIAAFINSILLFIAIIYIVNEAIQRLHVHVTIASQTVIWVAVFGVLINGITAFFFFHDRHQDLNIKGAFLHMLLDAAVSVGVIVAGLIMMWNGWYWVDPLLSIIIAIILMLSTWSLFKESLNLILLAVPTNIDLSKLEKLLKKEQGLIDYHDLHIWPISTTEIALSAHLVVMPKSFSEQFTKNIEQKITKLFPISHVTLQLELQDGDKCETRC